MFLNCSWKKKDLSLPQVGGQRWVELSCVFFFFFALKGNLLILIPKTPTDWLTDLPLSSDFFFDSYWSLFVWILFSFVFRVRRRRRCCVVDWDWDWNHRRPVKKQTKNQTPHIRFEAAWCFCRKKRKSGVTPKELSLFAPGFIHRGDDFQADNAKELKS